jgi:hypothetical protein
MSKLSLLEVMLIMSKKWKRVIWADEWSYTLFHVWRTPKEICSPECLVQTMKHGGGSLGINIAVFSRANYYPSWPKYCKGICGDVNNQVHPTIQTLLPSNDVLLQDNNSHSQSWDCSLTV